VRIAFNVVQGRGSTYDLLVPTNGYHPLWLVVQLPFFLGADSPVDRLGLLIKLWAAVAVFSAVAWSLLIRRLTGNDRAAGLTALLFGLFGWSLSVLYSGMETPLVLLLLALFYWWVFRMRQKPSARPGLRLLVYAALGTLTFLSRLDSFFLLLPSLLLVGPTIRRCRARDFALAGVAAGVLLLPWAWWNLHALGTLVPVSGTVKTVSQVSFSRSLDLLSRWQRRMTALGFAAWHLYAAAGMAVGVVASVAWKLARHHRPLYLLVFAVGAGAVAHYLYYLLFFREINVPWHVYPQVTLLYLSVVALYALGEIGLARFAAKGARRAVVIASLLTTFVVALTAITFVYRAAKQVRMVEPRAAFAVGRWVAKRLPADARVAMYDSFHVALLNPDRVVVDLNGLVENPQGARLAKNKRRAELMQLRGCTHRIRHFRGALPKPVSAYLQVFPYREQGSTHCYTIERISRSP
jgi:hypothetical protein